MRFRTIVLSFSLLLVLLAMVAFAADWMHPEGKSADELISGGEYESVESPEGVAANPKLQRETVWQNKTLDWTMPSTVTGGGISAKASRAQAQSNEDAQDTSAETTDNAASTPESTSMAGGWSFELVDDSTRQMVLTLFQNGDSLFGTGSMVDGDSSLAVTASGTVDGNSMNLDVTSMGTIGLYHLNLTVSGDSASGDYEAVSASGSTWSGSVEGIKTI
ncbi:MAG: hypothetical protein HPY61_01205 [Methanotrichaceae archaeon]|nr:hypothetical protein [Methanotrichaceae archaeon]